MKLTLEMNASDAKIAIESGALLMFIEKLADSESELKDAKEKIKQDPVLSEQAQPMPHPVQQPMQQPVQSYQQPMQQPMQQPAMQQPAMQQPFTPHPVQQPMPQPMPQPAMQQSLMPPPVQQAPVTAPAYTIDQLAVAATQLTDAGKRAEVLAILSNFGVNSLMSLPKDRYGEFATAIRAMGARI
jgi:outer membrane biosynthesis protein TonB